MKLKIKQWLQQETLLTITFVLAIASAFVVKPSAKYLTYIDWNTIALLMALMIVMAGFKKLGLFQKMGEKLLSKVKSQRAIEVVLVLACFFSSMIITNDVALITFVPFAIETLKMAGMKEKMLLVVVLQTVAANLGSMVTPIGNPQNIYLYFQSGFSASEFFAITLPFAFLSFILLMFFICMKKDKPVEFEVNGIGGTIHGKQPEAEDSDLQEGFLQSKKSKFQFGFYTIMFLLCLLSLSRIFPVTTIAVLVVVLTCFVDMKIIWKVDYSLLLTFINFFIFVGNMQHIELLSNTIVKLVSGNELLAAIVISQVISNVPAALLLTGFTQSWKLLIVGSNLGGLGTLIASMASLISYKYIAKERPTEKMKYLAIFTAVNIIFLAANMLMLIIGDKLF